MEHSPRQMKYFTVIDALTDKATGEVPAVNGNSVHLQEEGQQSLLIQQGHVETPTLPLVLPQYGQMRESSRLPMIETPPDEYSWREPSDSNRTWRPGTFGFDSHDDASPFEREDTFSMIVLKGIVRQQGQSTPVMQSEISGAASSAAVIGAGAIVGNVFKYGNNLMIQRGFGPGPYGLYTLSFAIVTLVSSIFNLGLDDAMVRYTSVYRGKKQPHLLRGLAIFCSALAGVTGMLGAFIVLYLTPYIATLKRSPEVLPILLIMVPIIPLMCMQTVWSAGLQGFKAFRWRVLTQRLLIPGVLLLLLVPVLLFFHNIILVATALLLSTLICTVLSLFFFFRKLSDASNQRARGFELREWIGFAVPNFLTSIVDTVLDSVDTVLLAVFAISNIAIGQYGATIRIAIFISMPLQALNTMFSPTIAELYSKGEKQKLAVMFQIVTKWAITLSLPIFWIAVLFSWALLGIAGSGFVPAWPLLIVLAIGNLINVGTGSVGYMLLMTGHQKITFLNSLTAIVFNIVLGIFLVPRFGAMGIAIATGVALSVVNLMRLLQVYVFLKMVPYRWDTLKPIAAGLISAALTGGLIYLFSFSNLSLRIGRANLSLELLLIPVFIALYFALLAAFRISPEDQIVLGALRRKLKRSKK